MRDKFVYERAENHSDEVDRKQGDALVKHLRQCLRHRDFYVRHGAALLLGQIGRNARDAIPDLQVASSDEDPRVAKVARMAIRKIEK
jgi:HEAT repeat protein